MAISSSSTSACVRARWRPMGYLVLRGILGVAAPLRLPTLLALSRCPRAATPVPRALPRTSSHPPICASSSRRRPRITPARALRARLASPCPRHGALMLALPHHALLALPPQSFVVAPSSRVCALVIFFRSSAPASSY
ncbi:hypothetical protein DENSPDRAFT_882109 [Dentipellis sp. KUC8613]|nr:hypothetical protein DENSPDRAFT_882109 [Dentipellis sp. KUC8613]